MAKPEKKRPEPKRRRRREAIGVRELARSQRLRLVRLSSGAYKYAIRGRDGRVNMRARTAGDAERLIRDLMREEQRRRQRRLPIG